MLPLRRVSPATPSGGAIGCVLDLRGAIVPAACRARSERYLQESGLPAFVLARSNCHWFQKRFLKSHKKPASKIFEVAILLRITEYSLLFIQNPPLAARKNFLRQAQAKEGNPFMRYSAVGSMSSPQRTTKGNVPNIVALEVLRKNGIDVDKLIKLITAGVGAEFTTYYYYTILRMHCTGLEGEGIKEIVEDARIEDRNHFEAMVPRLYELGGSLPRDIRKFADQAGCPDAYLPDNWEDINSILKVLLEAEQCAIRSWGEVCDMTTGKDPRTYDIAQRIMQEEVEHEAWFIELLSKRPSGHFRRKFVGQSPHTGDQGSLIHL